MPSVFSFSFPPLTELSVILAARGMNVGTQTQTTQIIVFWKNTKWNDPPIKKATEGKKERDIAFPLRTLIFYFVGGSSIILKVPVTINEGGLSVCVLPDSVHTYSCMESFSLKLLFKLLFSAL